MRIHHIGYLVRNMERSRAEFEQLGFSVERCKAHDEARGINVSFMTNGGYRVELVEPDGKSSPIYPLLKRFKNCPYHICFETDDMAAAIAQLRGKGFTVMQGADTAPCITVHSAADLVDRTGGRGAIVAFLMSAAAGIVEVMQAK